MAGHSKFANIKHRKAAQDSKRAKEFTKLVKAIVVAAQKGQPDPAFNPSLFNAIAKAKKAGVPKDRIEKAIKQGAGETDGENYEEIRYEGYGAGGIAIIVEALTDNKNRTAADVRSRFSKNGGSMGETGSVSFMFDKVGQILFKSEVASFDDVFEAALEAGAQECEEEDGFYQIIAAIEDFNQVLTSLQAVFGDAEDSGLIWKARDLVEVDFEKAEGLLKLIEALEDSDDVQDVFGNYAISDEVLAKLSEG